jgi:hypothetical protein
MADYKKIVSVIKKRSKGFSNQWYGGGITECDLGTSFNVFLKKDVKNDSSNGIDWTTFKLYADELGYDASCENFKNMPSTIYNVLFKLKYWDSIGGDKIKNQGIANVIVEKQGVGLAIILLTLNKFGYIRPYKNLDITTNITNSFGLTDDDINFINKLDAEGKSPLLFDEIKKEKDIIYWISKRYVLRTSEKIALGVGVLLIGYLSYKLIKR